MTEYIEREAVINELLRYGMTEDGEAVIRSIPSADVAPVKHGKWIPHIEEDYIGEGQYGYIELLKCSECGTLVPNKRNFCHHCGADMRPAQMSGTKEEDE